MSILQTLQNRAAFKRAKEQAGEDGRVCGITDEEGTPRYFVVGADASEEEIQARAFEARYGRPMNRSEQLLASAMNGDFVRAYEQAMTTYIESRDTEDA